MRLPAVSFKMSFKNDELTLAVILENKGGSGGGGEKILVFPQGKRSSLNGFFNLKATLIAYTNLHILIVAYSVALYGHIMKTNILNSGLFVFSL